MATNAEWLVRFERVTPWGSGTCSKSPAYTPEEPAVIVRGKGCRVWDADGREFIDFRNALGPVTIGYANEEVNEAITKQLADGIIFGQPAPLECEVAEIICETVPCAEKARFVKTGGEAIAACVKIARAYTGRGHIIQIGYNGWLNSLARGTKILPNEVAGELPGGVPAGFAEYHHACAWNDTEAVEELFDEHKNQIAAVVVACDYINAEAGHIFYTFLRKLTCDNGALLIFDEIVMGMRIAIGGAHEYFNVDPELAVLSKGIANGMPLAAYLGRADVMDACGKNGSAVVSSTFAGETLSLAAAKKCFEIYKRENVVQFLWDQGKKMWDGLNGIFQKKRIGIKIAGLYPYGAFVFGKDVSQERFLRAAYRNGVSLYTGASYMNFSHADADVDEALDRLSAACDEFIEGGV